MEDNFKNIYTSLFHQYYSSLLFYATRLVGGEEEAEDIVQDVFAELWKRKESVEIGDQIQSFLYRSVYTKSLNFLKHKSIVDQYNTQEEELHNRRLEFYQPDNSEVIKRIENKELHAEINTAINELPDKCQKIFKLSYLHDLKNKEIADIMGVSLRTVEAHMYKALKFLRKRLEHLTLFLCLIFLKLL